MDGLAADAAPPLLKLSPRRAVTLPVRPTSSGAASATSTSSADASSDDGHIETLYAHPSVRIVSFTTSSAALKATVEAGEQDDAGKLPCFSRLERTIAVGLFRIYKAPGSVAFLSCRDALQPILPKSQCWCVDEDSSKFVLQIRPPQFWRIELPNITTEDHQRLDELRVVFDRILQFEKTICPFQRTFTVELPEPTTPIIKVPWKPKVSPSYEANSPLEAVSSSPPPTRSSPIQCDTPTAAEIDQRLLEETAESADDDGDLWAQSPARADERDVSYSVASTVERIEDDIQKAELLARQIRRTQTAPPELRLDTSPTAEANRPLTRQRGESIVSISSDLSSQSHRSFVNQITASSSVESFHSTESWHSPTTPLQTAWETSASALAYQRPGGSEGSTPTIPTRPTTSSEPSAVWTTPERRGVDENPATPNTVDDDDNDHFVMAITSTSTPSALRHRKHTAGTTRRRALSPLPHSANLFSPPRHQRGRMQTARHLPTLILQKTCEILLSPPSHLLNLMLDIAAKIAAGEWRGLVFGLGESGETMKVRWDYSEADPACDDWEEDDYGMSPRAPSTEDFR